MVWPLIAMAAVNAASAYSSGSVAAAQAKANNRLAAADAGNANRVRTAGNAFSAARGSLARYMQSLQNNQALEAGGKALEENLINARRHDDTLQRASFEDQIRDSEQMGAQAAAAAFAGVGGEVADMVSVSTRLMQQRAALDAARSRDFSLYDTAQRAAAIQTQTVRSLDSSLIFDSIDYTIDVAKQQHVPNPTSQALLAAGQTLLSGFAGGMGGAGSGKSAGAGSLFRAKESFSSYGSGSAPASIYSFGGSNVKFGI